LTGYCEEIVFREILPHILKLILFHNSALACVSQAGLFALGHTSPNISKDENKTVGSIQFLNGLWAGVLYLLVDGDIVPCVTMS
jgi:membrane protease YdiL (CAAX protease family)